MGLFFIFIFNSLDALNSFFHFFISCLGSVSKRIFFSFSYFTFLLAWGQSRNIAFFLFLISLFFFVDFPCFGRGVCLCFSRRYGRLLFCVFFCLFVLFYIFGVEFFLYIFLFFVFLRYFFLFSCFLSLPLSLIVQYLTFRFEINHVLLAYLCCGLLGHWIIFKKYFCGTFILCRFLARNVLQICREDLCGEILIWMCCRGILGSHPWS